MSRRALLALALATLLAHAPTNAAQGADACDEGAALITCHWSFDTEARAINAATDADNATRADYEFRLPVFERTLATVSVARLGPDNGWNFTIVETRVESDGTRVERDLSRSEHGATADGSDYHREETTHLLLTRSDGEYWLRLTPGFAQMRQFALALAQGPPSRFQVTYVGENLPAGDVPVRPAGTEDDPHLADLAGDVVPADQDIVAVWFDDERVGDGLMDVHLKVRSLETFTFESPSTGQAAERIDWKVVFYLDGRGYYVAWEATPDPNDVAEARFGGCALRVESESDTQAEEILASPACSIDRDGGVFHATFPLRAVGSPPDGQVFEDITARTRQHRAPGADPQSRAIVSVVTEVIDDRPEKRYDFALGGPAVWSALDGGRKDVALSSASLPWYQDPFASENLPDSLQVLGTFVAILTFVGGLVLVSQARRNTRRLLGRIDEVERANEQDARRALLELGKLESELTLDYRRGRIREAQYQLASQRIASAAARMALRRDFGLDDGVPDAPRRIPVEGEARDAVDATYT